MAEDKDDDYYTFYIFGIKFELWYFILSINIIFFIISYIAYRITFFHGYQVSLDKTLNKLQNNSNSGMLIESKKNKVIKD